MINPVTQSSTSSAAAATSQANASGQTSRTQLGKDQFLTLLVTQLRNQDPMSPLQPYEFAAQLAQFSSVEQLSQLNDQMSAQSQVSQITAMLEKTNFGASLIGREVLAQDDQVTIPTSGSAEVKIDVGTGGGTATLKLVDSTGKTVATRDLGQVSGGLQTLKLPSDLPPGDYHYQISVKSGAGKDVAVTPYVTGRVDGVIFKDGTIQIQIGSLDIPLESVTQVKTADSGASKP